MSTPREVKQYRKRVSGPILDRIDLHVEVPEVDVQAFRDNQKSSLSTDSSLVVRERIAKVRNIQETRFVKELIYTNAEMRNAHIKNYASLTKEAELVLTRAALQYWLSARSFMNMIKIARTIADLENTQQIEKHHMAEALQYRPKAYELE